MEYTGPGRAIPEPEHLETVKIGFIGPIRPTVSVATGGRSHEEALGTEDAPGRQLAIEQANARGGYLKRKIPFELVVSNDNGLWGASGNEIIKMAYKDNVWAILGTIDGANTHIAIRVALKAEIVMMNSGDTDPTLDRDEYPLGLSLHRRRSAAGLPAGRLHVRQAESEARRRHPRQQPLRSIRRARDPRQQPPARPSDRAGNGLSVGRRGLLAAAGSAAQRERRCGRPLGRCRRRGSHPEPDARDGHEAAVTSPATAASATSSSRSPARMPKASSAAIPWNPERDDPKLDKFRAEFRERFGEEPETYAAHAYDGMNMLIWAIQTAGLNRAKIRDVLAHRTEPWPGVTGDIVFSAVLDDDGEVFLAEFKGGKWNYHSRNGSRSARAARAGPYDWRTSNNGTRRT